MNKYRYEILPLINNYWLIEIYLDTVFLLNFSFAGTNEQANMSAYAFIQGIKYANKEPLDFIPYEQVLF